MVEKQQKNRFPRIVGTMQEVTVMSRCSVTKSLARLLPKADR